MKEAFLLFPHHVFKNTSHLLPQADVFLVEDSLFFNQYHFHKQKLVFHRASMKFYEAYLNDKGFDVTYIEAITDDADIRVLIPKLIRQGYSTLHCITPTDNWLEQRIKAHEKSITLMWYDTPLFLNTREDLASFFKPSKKKLFQTSFYKEQRKKRRILMNGEHPEGGQWTFDKENRKKYPKGKLPPPLNYPSVNIFYTEAVNYVIKYFPNALGAVDKTEPIYPTTFQDAEKWLTHFLETRFYEFGDYEDAIVKDHHFLNHSVISPLLNVGLLCVRDVVEKTIEFGYKQRIPINSLEGFVRQIIGWREFIRGVYIVKGTEERNCNFWQHQRKIPVSFYEGTTGIVPIDTTIKKILKTGYAHHIERLMILGNFMTLCEFHPDEVHRWFMELFIDAYDWVMVPNVYGMSLFADGGLMSTKPYISSSNYIKKMSDYKTGSWQAIWDGLFWTFMDKHRSFFKKNPRLGMLITNFDTMDNDKKHSHFEHAQMFFKQLETTPAYI